MTPGPMQYCTASALGQSLGDMLPAPHGLYAVDVDMVDREDDRSEYEGRQDHQFLQ